MPLKFTAGTISMAWLRVTAQILQQACKCIHAFPFVSEFPQSLHSSDYVKEAFLLSCFHRYIGLCKPLFILTAIEVASVRFVLAPLSVEPLN